MIGALADAMVMRGGAGWASSTLLNVLNGGRYEDAAEQLLRWDLAGGVENAGLKARREAEFVLWGGGTEKQKAAA